MNRKELIEQLLDGEMNDSVYAVVINSNGDKIFFELEGIAQDCDSKKHGNYSYSPTILIEEIAS